jgi:sugar lactone lactonase YvrE
LSTVAKFSWPRALAFGGDALYIADSGNYRIRMIRNGQVSTLAGTGVAGFVDGPASRAQFSSHGGLAASDDGTVYVADPGNHRIRMIRSGHVSTIAGDGTSGFADGPAEKARFRHPSDVAIGQDGTLYVADSGNERIRMIRDGQVSTIAGCGIAGFADGSAETAKFSSPNGVAVGEDGAVYITDSQNHRIRMIRNGKVSTLAGSTPGVSNGPAKKSQFSWPCGISISKDGTLYVSDTGKHRVRVIREGQVFTLAGNERFGLADGHAA